MHGFGKVFFTRNLCRHKTGRRTAGNTGISRLMNGLSPQKIGGNGIYSEYIFDARFFSVRYHLYGNFAFFESFDKLIRISDFDILSDE